MHFSNISKVSYSKNTLYTGIMQFYFLLQNYVTPPKLPNQQYNLHSPHQKKKFLTQAGGGGGGACHALGPLKWHQAPDVMSRNPSATKKEPIPRIYHIISTHTDPLSYADTELNFQTTTISHLEDLSHSVITYQYIQTAAREDTNFSKLQSFITHGFPTIKKLLDPALRGYWKVRSQLTHSDDIICLDQRIVIPQKLQKQVLQHLHAAHQGITSMKARANQCLLARNVKINKTLQV